MTAGETRAGEVRRPGYEAIGSIPCASCNKPTPYRLIVDEHTIKACCEGSRACEDDILAPRTPEAVRMCEMAPDVPCGCVPMTLGHWCAHSIARHRDAQRSSEAKITVDDIYKRLEREVDFAKQTDRSDAYVAGLCVARNVVGNMLLEAGVGVSQRSNDALLTATVSAALGRIAETFESGEERATATGSRFAVLHDALVQAWRLGARHRPETPLPSDEDRARRWLEVHTIPGAIDMTSSLARELAAVRAEEREACADRIETGRAVTDVRDRHVLDSAIKCVLDATVARTPRRGEAGIGTGIGNSEPAKSTPTVESGPTEQTGDRQERDVNDDHNDAEMARAEEPRPGGGSRYTTPRTSAVSPSPTADDLAALGVQRRESPSYGTLLAISSALMVVQGEDRVGDYWQVRAAVRSDRAHAERDLKAIRAALSSGTPRKEGST